MTSASQRFREFGFDAASLHAVRAAAPHLSQDAGMDVERMLRAISSGDHPRFWTFSAREALRREGGLCHSPLAGYAACGECGECADACRCAGSGRLRAYHCQYCDAPCEDGEDCCAPPDDDDAHQHASAPHDGYSRHAWSAIPRRDVAFYGERTDWAPYYCGVEFETDSTPSASEWRDISDSRYIAGAWHDGTVRGPEIASQPCKGRALATVAAMLSKLSISLTSAAAPIAQQCGMHVHVDCRHASAATRVAMVRLWLAVQDAVWCRPEMAMRQAGGYCGRLSRAEAEQAIRVIEGGDSGYPTRYRDFNAAALAEHSTIEIRAWGWPDNSNSPEFDRFAFMWRCIRTTQAIRLAARYIGQSGLGAKHPVYSLDSATALELIESLVPIHPSQEDV